MYAADDVLNTSASQERQGQIQQAELFRSDGGIRMASTNSNLKMPTVKS